MGYQPHPPREPLSEEADFAWRFVLVIAVPLVYFVDLAWLAGWWATLCHPWGSAAAGAVAAQWLFSRRRPRVLADEDRTAPRHSPRAPRPPRAPQPPRL